MLGVQGVAAKGAERLGESGGAPRRDAGASAVKRIADDRKTDVREVNPDLVRTAGFELDAHQGVRAKSPEYPIVRHGRSAVAPHRHLESLCAVPADRLIDRTAACHHSGTHR